MSTEVFPASFSAMHVNVPASSTLNRKNTYFTLFAIPYYPLSEQSVKGIQFLNRILRAASTNRTNRASGMVSHPERITLYRKSFGLIGWSSFSQWTRGFGTPLARQGRTISWRCTALYSGWGGGSIDGGTVKTTHALSSTHDPPTLIGIIYIYKHYWPITNSDWNYHISS